MQRYRYRDGFEGFLCAVADCLSSAGEPTDFVDAGLDNENGLFAELTVDVATDRQTALQFRERFVESAGREQFATARYAFHSRLPGIELELWHYFKTGLVSGRKLGLMLADRHVSRINRLARSVAHEAHKYKGFVRFREVREGFLYAAIEPQADIIEFLAPHFSQRVSDRPWMIHDRSRNCAVLYDLEKWRLVHGVEMTGEPEYTEHEQACSDLWRGYFRLMAIRERHNPALQRQHVPLRSRKYLLEFGE